MTLILASRSPRRRELLAQFGLSFKTQEADLDEAPIEGESPETMTERLAVAKALHIYRQNPRQTWVLGGDTTVALGNQVFGKPADAKQATEMLSALSGTTHRVVSAVALIGENFRESCICTTEVTFDKLTSGQIQAYCESKEPFDKAGGYGIQGLAGAYVKQLRGSYSGVVGLPLYETRKLLESANLLQASSETV